MRIHYCCGVMNGVYANGAKMKNVNLESVHDMGVALIHNSKSKPVDDTLCYTHYTQIYQI